MRFGRLLLCLALTGVAASAATTAEAATFPVYSCWAGSSSMAPGWQVSKGPSFDGNVNMYPACEDAGQGLVARNVWTTGVAPAGASGSFDFNAPVGTAIAAVHYDYSGNGGGGWQGQLWRSGWGPDWLGRAQCFPYSYAGCNGSTGWSRLDDAMPYGTSKLSFQFQCTWQTGCTRGTNWIGSMHLRNIEVDLEDFSNPGVGSESGSLWRDWVRATVDLGWGAGDAESGISRTWGEVDHRWMVQDVRPACDNRQLKPCPDSGGYGTLDTRQLADGQHTVYVYATNDANMTGAPATRAIGVDNTAQASPAGLAVSGEGDWKSTPGFVATYGIPGSTAPLTGGTYELCRLDGSDCQRGAADLTGSQQITLPAMGEWHVRYGDFTDAAGNGGGWSGWSDPMRYDPTVPGNSAPEHANGWINRTEYRGYHIGMDLYGSTPGPSGIAGYAVTTNGSLPGSVINAPVTDPTTYAASYDITGLAEGVTTVRARAISGAGVPAPDDKVEPATIKVDLTPPSAAASGAPAGSDTTAGSTWQGHPVSLTFTGTDQPALSGMGGAAPEDPVTAGAYVEYRTDRGEWQRVRGGTATLTLASSGDHLVDYRAVDLAGNVSDLHTLRIRVDTTAPSGGMEPPDPNDPTKVTFHVADECISAATIQMRPGGGNWQDLETQVQGSEIVAHIPDSAYAAGDYEVRALVTDCAGNTSVLDRWRGGQGAGQVVLLHLPLRVATVMRAWRVAPATAASRRCRKVKAYKWVRDRHGKRHRRKTTRRVCGPAKRKPKRKRRKKAHKAMAPTARAAAATAPGGPVKVAGTLATADGRPLSAAPVDLQVRIAGTQQWSTVASGQTDNQGSIQLTAPAGPSREFRLTYGGTDVLLGSASAALAVSVPARSSIAADHTRLRNGRRVHFHGTLVGGHVPTGGRQVELDGYNPAKRRWVPVATPRTNRAGRWSASYRFTATRGRVVYRFRLRIAPETDYPFALGYSTRTIAVTVTG